MVNADIDKVQCHKNTASINRVELIKDKYDIDIKTYNRESEKGYLQAVEYLVNQLTPTLTATITSENSKKSFSRGEEIPTTGMKSLIRNLASYQKECCTEVCILESLFASKKKISDTEIITETKIKTPVKPKRKVVSETSETSAVTPKLKCPNADCAKVYTTKGALMFHIRTKHADCESTLIETAKSVQPEPQPKVSASFTAPATPVQKTLPPLPRTTPVSNRSIGLSGSRYTAPTTPITPSITSITIPPFPIKFPTISKSPLTPMSAMPVPLKKSPKKSASKISQKTAKTQHKTTVSEDESSSCNKKKHHFHHSLY